MARPRFRPSRLTIAAGGVVAAIGLLGPSAASAEHVHCGEVVRHSIELSNDLVSCKGPGLIVGAGGITIDLDGHTIDGDKSKIERSEDHGQHRFVGIANGGAASEQFGEPREGFDDVAVRGGEISEFSTGVSFVRANDGDVENMRFAGVDTAMTQATGVGLYFADNRILDSNEGIQAAGQVRNATVVHNRIAAFDRAIRGYVPEAGFESSLFSHSVIASNRIRSAVPHVEVWIGGDHTDVRGNVLTNVDLHCSPCAHSVIARNTLHSGSIELWQDMHAITHNRVLGNVLLGRTAVGINLELGSGPFVSGGRPLFGSNNVVEGNRVHTRDTLRGISVRDAVNTRIEDNDVAYSGDAIWVGTAVRTTVSENRVHDSDNAVTICDPPVCSPIAARQSTGTSVTDNRIVGTRHDGIRLFATYAVNVARNWIDGHGGDNGVTVIYGARRNRIAENDVRREKGGGIALVSGSNENTVEDNEVEQTGGAHYGGYVPAGLNVVASDDNTLVNNRISNNRLDGTFIGTDPDDAPTETSDRTRVVGNLFEDNAKDGLHVSDHATATRIVGNDATSNDDDGIDVEAPGTLLRDNFAAFNLDLGIEAVAGVRDGGGNVARRNGDRRECIHVPCRRG